MRAVVYNGPRDVAVNDVPDARIERLELRRRPWRSHKSSGWR